MECRNFAHLPISDVERYLCQYIDLYVKMRTMPILKDASNRRCTCSVFIFEYEKRQFQKKKIDLFVRSAIVTNHCSLFAITLKLHKLMGCVSKKELVKKNGHC